MFIVQPLAHISDISFRIYRVTIFSLKRPPKNPISLYANNWFCVSNIREEAVWKRLICLSLRNGWHNIGKCYDSFLCFWVMALYFHKITLSGRFAISQCCKFVAKLNLSKRFAYIYFYVLVWSHFCEWPCFFHPFYFYWLNSSNIKFKIKWSALWK